MSNGMPASGHATGRVPGHATSRSNAYAPALVRELIMGPNPLRLCEETLDDAAAHGCALAPGSLVLDLGSGRGLTSAFLARHWGVRVVAADLWGNPADALATSARLGLGARDVLPVHADACGLPFAEEVFDAVTCIDAYNYFGRDESYLGQRLFAAQRDVRVERIRDLSCNDEAWRDWVACDNPYAAGDRRAIEAGSCLADHHRGGPAQALAAGEKSAAACGAPCGRATPPWYRLFPTQDADRAAALRAAAKTRGKTMPKGASESYALLNVTLLDGSEHMEPQRGMAVITEGSKISWVGPAACAQVPSGAREMDMGGACLMPGLVNMHVHLCGSGKPVSAGNAGDLMRRLNNAPGRAIVRRVLAGSARQQLASGVTTVRGAGDPLFGDLAVRDAIESGRLEGPRLVATGTGITVPGGHGAGLFAQVANVPEEAAAMVRDLFAHKADVIKLFITGGVFDATEPGEPGVVRMPLEVARAACAQAHELGLPVMAHVESTEGVRQALLAGVDTIEHGAKMTPEIVGLYRGSAGTQLAGRPASVTCTISPALPFVKLPPEKTHSTDVQKVNGDIVCEGIIESARQALAEGIPVGLGTDSSCPYVTQYDMWRELAYFSKYVGVTPAFALHTATQVNAGLLGLGGVCGTVAAGMDADLVLTHGNPLDDLSALREPLHVLARGHLVRRSRVKRMPELDAELDQIMALPA